MEWGHHAAWGLAPSSMDAVHARMQPSASGNPIAKQRRKLGWMQGVRSMVLSRHVAWNPFLKGRTARGLGKLWLLLS